MRNVQAHLLDSEEPLKGGQTYIAKCGAEVINAFLVFTWDVERVGHPEVKAFYTCKKCWLSTYRLRYLSGMITGELAKQLENREQVSA